MCNWFSRSGPLAQNRGQSLFWWEGHGGVAGPEDGGLAMGYHPLIPVQLSVWFPRRPAGVTVLPSRIGGLLPCGQNLWEREESTLKLTAQPGYPGAGEWEGLGEEERVRGWWMSGW